MVRYNQRYNGYIKSITEIGTCVGIYHTYCYVEKKSLRNGFLPFESWSDSEVLTSLQEDSIQNYGVILKAGLAYALCRGVSPIISNVISRRTKNFDIILATSTNGIANLPRQNIFLYTTMALSAMLAEPGMLNILKRRETDEQKRNSSLNFFQSFSAKSVNLLFDAFLFHSYLFRRLYFLAGPVVAHSGTAVAFAASHSARHLSEGGISVTSFFTDMFTSLCCQVGYHFTGRLSLAVICSSLALFQESLSALEYSLIESSSLWRQIIYYTNWKYHVGTITLPNDHALLYFNKSTTNSSSLSSEELRAAQDFIDRYSSYYIADRESSEKQSLNWEDVMDIIYNFRAILALILHKHQQINLKRNPAMMTQQDLDTQVIETTNSLSTLLSTDSIGSWAYSTYGNQRISSENMKELLLNEFMRVGITCEQLKSFEESFREINSILNCESSPNKEAIVLEIIDAYFKSVLHSLLKTSLGISPQERLASLPLFPDAILEGISVTPPPPTTVRNTSRILSRKDYEDLCFASRRGAQSVLGQYGLTIRRWNQLLDYYSNKYPNIEERKQKWIQYLNGQDFEQLILTYQRGLVVDPFGQD